MREHGHLCFKPELLIENAVRAIGNRIEARNEIPCWGCIMDQENHA